MSTNQLPENMGKKIVEALRRQAMYGEDFANHAQESVSEPEQFVLQQKDSIVENNINEIDDEPVLQSQISSMIEDSSNQFSIASNSQSNLQSISYNSYATEMPTNVAVLKKLISQLPAGVSKQIGAQIIRQTIEALGISMNSVLQEAQQVQEDLNNSVSECNMKIQEYKKQIMQLEANSRDYQRQMTQINDLISLFILTDKKTR
jgi:hypothetical protein